MVPSGGLASQASTDALIVLSDSRIARSDGVGSALPATSEEPAEESRFQECEPCGEEALARGGVQDLAMGEG